MHTNGSLLLRSLLFASLPALAAAQPPAPAAPAATATPAPLPTPAPEVQKLQFLIGDWVHDETFQPGPMGPGGTGKGRSKSALALGDHYVYTIYTTNSPMGKLEARGFFGWDGEKKHYTMSWFDNMGLATDFTGTFDAEGALVMNAEYAFQGTPVKERFTIKKQSDGKLVFQSAMQGPDGAWKTAMESVATPATK
jgi:Protein of unknown function (DUF1579)